MILAYLLPFVCLIAALLRAPIAAIPLAPPCLLIASTALGLVDLSSASHPLRWIVPVTSAGLAFLVAWYSAATYSPSLRAANVVDVRRRRMLIASLLIIASSGPDLLALHPFFWERFATWPLVPFQIGVCLSILGVLVVPERWLRP